MPANSMRRKSSELRKQDNESVNLIERIVVAMATDLVLSNLGNYASPTKVHRYIASTPSPSTQKHVQSLVTILSATEYICLLAVCPHFPACHAFGPLSVLYRILGIPSSSAAGKIHPAITQSSSQFATCAHHFKCCGGSNHTRIPRKKALHGFG